MSHQLARRTGTVRALVAAASMTMTMTMTAGLWPPLGVAFAQPAAPVGSTTPNHAEPTADSADSPPEGSAVPEEKPVQDPSSAQKQAGRQQRAAAADARASEQAAKEPVSAHQDPARGPQSGLQAELVTALPTSGSDTDPGEPPAAPEADESQGRSDGAKSDGPTSAAPREQPAGGTGAVVGPTAEQTQGSVIGPPTGTPVGRAEAPPAAATRSRPVGPVVPVAAAVGTGFPVAATMGPPLPERTARRAEDTAVGTRPIPVTPRTSAVSLPLRPRGVDPAPRALPDVLPDTPADLAALPYAVSGAAESVAARPALPIGIALVVVLFLLTQSRMDRRDPKLALARVDDDEPLEFGRAGEIVHLRLVHAA